VKTPNCKGRFGGWEGVIERETAAEGSSENVGGDGVLLSLSSSLNGTTSLDVGLGCRRVGYKLV